jgi:gluconate 2-dehydrogenase gamma chain
MDGLSRRNALKYFGLLAASAAGREFLSAWLPGANVRADGGGLVIIEPITHTHAEAEPRAVPYKPQFFKPGAFRTVEVLTEMILPTDDQPGAREARVAEYIDFVVFSAGEFVPTMQREWTDGLEWLERQSQRRFGTTFAASSEVDRVKLLTEMSLPERDASAHHDGYPFFRLVKEMTVEGFYTSKVGLIDVLNYQGMNYMADFPGCTHPEHQS